MSISNFCSLKERAVTVLWTPRSCTDDLILRGRKFGFLLEELRQWLEIYDEKGTVAQMQVFNDLAERKINELKEQQVQLAQTIEELKELRMKSVEIVNENTANSATTSTKS